MKNLHITTRRLAALPRSWRRRLLGASNATDTPSEEVALRARIAALESSESSLRQRLIAAEDALGSAASRIDSIDSDIADLRKSFINGGGITIDPNPYPGIIKP